MCLKSYSVLIAISSSFVPIVLDVERRPRLPVFTTGSASVWVELPDWHLNGAPLRPITWIGREFY